MTIKFENGNINAYATKTFIKRAQTFGTPEFYEWRAACKEFGKEVKLVAKTRSTKAQNEEKNMTYKNMVSYLSTRENKDALLEEFEATKKRSLIQENPREYVRMWFKAKVPNYNKVLADIANNAEEENKSEENNVVEMAEKVSA